MRRRFDWFPPPPIDNRGCAAPGGLRGGSASPDVRAVGSDRTGASGVLGGGAQSCHRGVNMCTKKEGCIPTVDLTDNWTLFAIVIGSIITLGFIKMTFTAIRYGLMDPPKVGVSWYHLLVSALPPFLVSTPAPFLPCWVPSSSLR
ncbi:Hypp1540 [Branchiostoma lanceolatum]|uniref:Hypp1540 protein n=1 Tax=Branchiostoma lanceolatum TaxID=7740 RepID=A0A8J9ZK53_BRALA|nr:Hypp1540 [Branchiostoma lanceolatum]